MYLLYEVLHTQNVHRANQCMYNNNNNNNKTATTLTTLALVSQFYSTRVGLSYTVRNFVRNKAQLSVYTHTSTSKTTLVSSYLILEEQIW